MLSRAGEKWRPWDGAADQAALCNVRLECVDQVNMSVFGKRCFPEEVNIVKSEDTRRPRVRRWNYIMPPMLYDLVTTVAKRSVEKRSSDTHI